MAKQNQMSPEELRYNYLGFEYEPGKLKEFWASDDEKKKFVDKIRARLGKNRTIERDFSVVNANQINKADRIIISIASIFLLLSFFLPYYNFEAFGSSISGSPISYFMNLGYVSNFVAWGGLVVKLVFVLSILMILISPAVGVLNLIALNTGLTKPNYFARLKSVGRLNIITLLLYLFLFVLVSLGHANPFGSLGIEALGENLSLGSLLGICSFSMWLSIGAHFLGSLPAMEL
ncbi:MAG: hypothetical protein GY839_08840 [candidate division Zixibacteria bacterium]|nr:hypothetical protein [candidate division Zixibacteria bacterium]